MNAVQIHLMMNHAPIMGVIAAFALLVMAHVWNSKDVLRVAMWVCVATGLATIPVFFTGEPVEKAVEHLPGVTENLIETHEDAARITFALLGGLGLLSLVALLRYRVREIPRGMATAALALALVAAVSAGWTGHLGGSIRHSELRAGAFPANQGGEAGEAGEAGGNF